MPVGSAAGWDVTAFEQFAADGFAGAAFEENVVGQDYGGAATDGEFADDVLQELSCLLLVVAQPSRSYSCFSVLILPSSPTMV